MAPRVGARSARGPRRWLALLRAGVLLALRFLALPLHARLLVVLTTASLGEDAGLLDLLVEAAEGAFERLVLTHADFCQSRFTSSGSSLECRRRARSHRRATARHRPVAEPPEHSRAPSEGQPSLGGSTEPRRPGPSPASSAVTVRLAARR